MASDLPMGYGADNDVSKYLNIRNEIWEKVRVAFSCPTQAMPAVGHKSATIMGLKDEPSYRGIPPTSRYARRGSVWSRFQRSVTCQPVVG